VLTGVAGHLPLTIGNITELTEIDIRDSNLSAGPVPDSIGLCTKLVTVLLNNCELQGQFPAGLRELKSLGLSINVNEVETLTLAANELSGSIPDWICDVVKLKVMHLSENIFTGIIPECIGSLNLLESLLIVFNELTGELPSGICDLVNLNALFIHNTLVEGIIIALPRLYTRMHR
jgi:LRR receptor-like serine/threonine-protein kinase FLS2